MCPLDVKSIDWEQMWKERMGTFHNARDMHWDKAAEGFEKQYSRSSYIQTLISKLDVDRSDTVLDVGCGTGTLAVPLAPRVKSITALDVSKEMLKYGIEKAFGKNILNIKYCHHDWDEVTIGKEVPPHDIVISSRAFHSRDPREALLKLNEAAKKCVYLTLRTSGDNAQNFFRSLYQELGKEYVTSPDYIYAYNLLYQNGILAHVDFITYTDEYRYRDANEAFKIISGHMQLTEEQKAKLMLFIKRNMEENGEFKLDTQSTWALLWWKK